MATTADPIFRSVGQALHTAYIMEVTPLAQKGGTQIVVEDMMRRGGYQSEAPVKTERSIDLGGMTPLEFRAQCSIIRQIVLDKLGPQERDSIHARYGRQLTRASGVRGMRDFFGAFCNARNDSAVLALVWSVYDNQNDKWSLRAMEREYGVTKAVLHRDRQVLQKLTGSMQKLAEGKLEEIFTGSGLVGEINN